jgi:hypothetical protein
MTRVDDAILYINKAKNVDIALAKARLFNAVKVQKSESKSIGLFCSNPSVPKLHHLNEMK